jgi:D-alanine-D-alanine ligase
MRIVALLDQTVSLERIRSRKGPWWEWLDAYVIEALRAAGHDVSLVQFGTRPEETLAALRRISPGLVFNLTQTAGAGDRGMEAYAAAMLELAGYPYTGAGPRGLLIAGDKALSKTILRANGIDVPDFEVVAHARAAARPRRYPVLVKPLNRGGSEGLARSSLVDDARALAREAKRIADAYGCPVICEEFIAGRELTAGVIGHERPRVLPPCEWQFGRGPQFVTERLKWDLAYCDRCGTTFEAASLKPALARRVADVCRRVYQALELRDYGSIDLRVTPDGRIVVLEANANPGLLPASRRWQRVPYPRLIAGIVRAALRRRPAARTDDAG